MSRNLVMIVLGVIGLAAAALLAVSQDPAEAVEAAPVLDARAPEFTLKNLAGESVSLSNQRGKVVLINFWATWCPPCRVEMPALLDRYQRHQPALVVLAVNNDEPADLVGDFVAEFGLTFPVLLDPGAQVQDLYQVRGYPSSYFVDEEGIIRVVHIGLMTEDQLDDYLTQMGLGG